MKNKYKFLLLFFILLCLFGLVSCKEEDPIEKDDRLTISFDTDGGSQIDEVKLNTGETFQVTQSTYKEGYDFVTWVYQNYEYDFSTPVTESLTLKAIWVKKVDEESEAIVYFNTDGGTFIAPVVVSIGETLGDVVDPIKIGYTFKYWMDEYDEKKFSLSTPIDSETYLKAYYEARKKISIKFDTDGGETIDEQIVYYGDSLGTLPKAVKEGYLFIGWYYNGSEIDESYIPSISITIHAKFAFIGDGYKTVTFKNEDGSLIETQKVEMGKGATSPVVTKTGYTFKGWSQDISFIYEDIEVKAIFEINEYTVIFKDDETIYDTQVITYLGSARAPYIKDKENQYFAGWSCSFDSITSDLEVVAKWNTIEKLTDLEKIEHTINLLMDNYDSNPKGDNIKIIHGEENLGTSCYYTSLNKDVLSNSGVITKAYTPTSVTMKVEIVSGIEKKTVTFDYLIPRTTMDLSNGISAAYLYSDFSGSKELLESTFDIYYLAFANFNSNGVITSLGEMGNSFVKTSLDTVHARGCYVVPSFRTTETFIAVATNEEARKNFASNIVKMINEYDLDGVDIDWEYPKGKDQIEGFSLMMKEIYTQVKANNPKHIVTCAILISGLSNFSLSSNIKYMDYVNMMSYEMHSTTVATHHTALYPSGKGGGAITNAVSYFNNAGVPNKKIIIGAAFFGRQYTASHGLGTSATYVSDALRYATIKKYADNPTTTCKRYWDDTSKAPYIYDSESGLFITYDDPESIGCKFDYAVSTKLAGVMCWQTGQDNGDLVQAFKDNYSKFKKS